VEVLAALAPIVPPWTLTGGAALAAFYTRHRTTRDLDLLWHGRQQLDELSALVANRLQAAGFAVTALQTAPAFVRVAVARGDDQVLVDLVAEPVAVVEPPVLVDIEGNVIQVDTAHEILVNKLCTLLERSELRDLVDVDALLQAGGDLHAALRAAPAKDAGFSVPTLAWVLRNLAVRPMTKSAGMKPSEAERIESIRSQLVNQLVELSTPEST
jgi:hypothetical protein